MARVRMLKLTKVDPAAGTGKLTFFPWDVNKPTSVCINLVSGKLSALPSESSTSDESESEMSFVPRDGLPSPSGRFVLRHSEDRSRGIAVEDSGGRQLEFVPHTRARDLSWSPNEKYFAFVVDRGRAKERSHRLYVYSMKQRKASAVASGSGNIRQLRWSADGHLLTCVRTLTQASEKLHGRVRESHGTVIVLDARRRFESVLTAGKLAGDYILSPSGARIAFIELVEDKYGDFDNHSVRVADIGAGRIRELLSTRRKPVYLWAGDDKLAVTTCDKYAVPTLSLLDLTGGIETKLVTERNFAAIEPLAYLPRQQSIIYKAAERLSDAGAEELWAVEPGQRPVCLFPKSRRHER